MMRKNFLVNSCAALALVAATAVGATDDDADYRRGMMGSGMMGSGMMDGGYGMGMMGMGPGMMGRDILGHGMMGGYGAFYGLDLNDDQKKQLTQIQDELRKKHWDLMGKMQDEYVKLRDLYAADTRDPSAIGQQMQRVFDLRRQMIESGVDAENRMETVLTAEQKAQLRKDMRSGCPMR